MTGILEHAARRECRMIVPGPADEHTLRRRMMGTTDERTFHRTSITVLTVRSRMRSPYRNVVILTDLSTVSRGAVLKAEVLASDADTVAFAHAHRVPFEGFLGRAANEPDFKGDTNRVFEEFIEPFRAARWLEERLRAQLPYGAPEEGLWRILICDVVVVGGLYCRCSQ